MSKAPDRSHLADAIHLMELVHLVDEEVPAANAIVERSKASAVTAQIELEKHQRWLEGHQELYAEAVKGASVSSNAKHSSVHASRQPYSLYSFWLPRVLH